MPPQVQLTPPFPTPFSSTGAIKAWIYHALEVRDIAPGDMEWIDSCIWLGHDLYASSKRDIDAGLYDFGASNETARILARAIEDGKQVS
jgi:hypothetical protein